jgi:hypothetical protein
MLVHQLFSITRPSPFAVHGFSKFGEYSSQLMRPFRDTGGKPTSIGFLNPELPTLM